MSNEIAARTDTLRVDVYNRQGHSIDDFVEMAADNETRKHDYVTPVKDVTFGVRLTGEEDRPIESVVTVDDPEYVSLFGNNVKSSTMLTLDDHSISQLCGKLGPDFFKSPSKRLPTDYIRQLRDIAPGLFGDTMNKMIEEYDPTSRRSTKWLMREYDGNLRAVLSENYARVDTLEVLEAVQTIQKEQGLPFEITHSHITPNNMSLRVITRKFDWDDDGTGSGNIPVGIGACIQTDEIGMGQIKVSPMVQNYNCVNTARITGEDAFIQRHVGNAEAIATLMLAALGGVFRASADLMNRLMKSRRDRLPNLNDVLDGIIQENGLGDKVREAAIAGTEGKRETVFDLWQGLTFAATRTEDVSDDTTDLLEEFAGNMLMRNDPVHYLSGFGHRQIRRKQLEEINAS